MIIDHLSTMEDQPSCQPFRSVNKKSLPWEAQHKGVIRSRHNEIDPHPNGIQDAIGLAPAFLRVSGWGGCQAIQYPLKKK